MGSFAALLVETATPPCGDGRDRWDVVSTHLMRRLLPDHRQETTRHQFAQNCAELLASAYRQPLPEMV
jgi:hypothetical protein